MMRIDEHFEHMKSQMRTRKTITVKKPIAAKAKTTLITMTFHPSTFSPTS